VIESEIDDQFKRSEPVGGSASNRERNGTETAVTRE